MENTENTVHIQKRRLGNFNRHVQSQGLSLLTRQHIQTVQVNVGKICNQACLHCHVEAGPKRTEDMSFAVARKLLDLYKELPSSTVLDITGGAPELNAHFRMLVEEASALQREVIDRCNLTVFFEEGMSYLPAFLAKHKVRVVASLPCYSEDNVDAQRGKGTFEKSLEALRMLGSLGYGDPSTGRILDLVYNPAGPSLPPLQAPLEASYKHELGALGIRFNSLLTLANLPVNRFAHALEREGQLHTYMDLLCKNFNPATLPGLMCRHQINVSWEGDVFDCDFNQMLDMPCTNKEGKAWNIMDMHSFEQVAVVSIRTQGHCFGCTAGSGSSCGGALTS